MAIKAVLATETPEGNLAYLITCIAVLDRPLAIAGLLLVYLEDLAAYRR